MVLKAKATVSGRSWSAGTRRQEPPDGEPMASTVTDWLCAIHGLQPGLETRRIPAGAVGLADMVGWRDFFRSALIRHTLMHGRVLAWEAT
jgi:hypothetical protein